MHYLVEGFAESSLEDHLHDLDAAAGIHEFLPGKVDELDRLVVRGRKAAEGLFEGWDGGGVVAFEAVAGEAGCVGEEEAERNV